MEVTPGNGRGLSRCRAVGGRRAIGLRGCGCPGLSRLQSQLACPGERVNIEQCPQWPCCQPGCKVTERPHRAVPSRQALGDARWAPAGRLCGVGLTALSLLRCPHQPRRAPAADKPRTGAGGRELQARPGQSCHRRPCSLSSALRCGPPDMLRRKVITCMSYVRAGVLLFVL